MPEIRYVIRDRAGNPIAFHKRIDFVDDEGKPDKDVSWVQLNGTPGLNGTSVKSMLYGLEMLDAFPDVTTVVVCEGEKAADALNRVGFLALATVCGATTVPERAVLEHLRGRKVVLWPDADAPEPPNYPRGKGRWHMEQIGNQLLDLGVEVNMAEWPEAPIKGDAADLVNSASGITPEEVKAAITLTTYVPPPRERPTDGRPDGCRVWKTDPARWEFHWPQEGLRNDGWLPIGTPYLLAWSRIQTAHLDFFYRAPGWVPSSRGEWAAIAGDLIEDRLELEAPSEETVRGRVLNHLVRFLGTEPPNDPDDVKAEPGNVDRGGSWWELETGRVHFSLVALHRDVNRHEEPGFRMTVQQLRQGIEELGGWVSERRKGSRKDRNRLSSIPWSVFSE